MPADRSSEPDQKTTLSQGLDVVRVLVRSGTPLGVTQVGQALGIYKSSAHRLLQILGKLGFVQQNPATLRYSLHPGIFGFIHEFASQFGPNTRVDPLLRAAASRLRCSVYLSMLGGRDTYVVCAAGDEGNTTQLGTHGPVYASSAGKILVARRPESEWPDYAPHPGDPTITEHTSLDPERFYKELRAARENGVAWNMRETTVYHASVAAPVNELLLPYPRMAVALLVRYQELPVHDRETLAGEVMALARQVSGAIATTARN
ncbi:transcriptional regulator [Opitutaceae bacterium TAV5]|nr:transcriptional regulator [Opitutaceae bacterium TAV5]